MAKRSLNVDPRLATLIALHIEACNAPDNSREERSAIRRRNALMREMGNDAARYAEFVGHAIRRLTSALVTA